MPHYDFNWQLQYRYAEPLVVPRGSQLIYTAWYDNSDKNPANPDPKKTVRWGQQTSDEMHLGYVEFVVDSGSSASMRPGLGGGAVGEFKFPKDGIPIPAQFKDAFKRLRHHHRGMSASWTKRRVQQPPAGRETPHHAVHPAHDAVRSSGKA